MEIRIKRRQQNQMLVWILILGSFFIAPMTQFLRFPGSIRYLLDCTWVFLVLTMLTKQKRKIDTNATFLLKWIILFLLYTIINYIIHFQSVFYYLWGFRNNFRGYALFFAVIFYFDKENIEEILDVFKKIFYINALIIMIEFFAFGYEQDNLGGIFGVESGCNAYLNLYLCIMLVVFYLDFCNGKKSLIHFGILIIIMLAIAAMAELKFFYVEFIILMIISSLVTRFSWKKLLIILLSALAIGIGYAIFINIFPYIDMSIAGLWETATSKSGYTSSGDLNRLNFMSTINRRFLPNRADQLFGLGLGNCDYAEGKDFITSPFYRHYENLHYAWMSTSFTYLENGWVGLIFFFGFFVIICIKSIALLIKKEGESLYCQIGFLCGIIAFFNGFYNVSLRLESGYMIYFILAIPWCIASEEKYLAMGNTGND